MSEKDALGIVQKLYEEQIVTKKEGNLLLATLAKNTLRGFAEEDQIRATLLHAILERLSYEDRK